MNDKGQEYRLKDGRIVSLIASYRDYFSEDEFLVLKEDDQIYIARSIEFYAAVENKKYLTKRTTNEKINLYRSYFRGNESMVATSFKNKEGKRVYYVLCHRRKKFPCPKLKHKKFHCSKCSVQEFQPLSNEIIFNHLRGYNEFRQETFYGIYPIMEDNKVCFLAFDFDKHNWKDEVSSLVKAIEEHGFKALLEISQSGNGCHVWLFFEESLSARKARKLGQLLLRKTMLSNPKLSFDSYDRMFPSQDELNLDGFGNLIALPLQGSRVVKGCSRFIDNDFNLLEDIWGTLSRTPKISEIKVDEVIEIIDNELPIEYYQLQKNKETELTLFEISEDTKKIFEDTFQVLVANELIINRADISQKALLQLKFMATFHNQNFYIAQRQRLSTYNIPRFICLATINDMEICLPRGLKHKVAKLFPKAEFVEKYSEGNEVIIDFIGSLYEEQEKAFNALCSQNMGVLSAGTGFGKTVIGAKLIASKKTNTLILVHNKNLAIQWKEKLERFLLITGEPFEEYTPKGRKKKKSQIGKIYGGVISRSNLVDIALFQSIIKRPDCEKILNQYGMIIVDEAHHVAAKTFEDVIKLSGSRYVYGLTATPKREDHLENIIFMRLGNIVYTAAKEIPVHINQKLLTRFTSLGEQEVNPDELTLHDNYELMLNSLERNQQIIMDIVENFRQKRHMIVLSRYVKHLEILKDLLELEELDGPIFLLNSKMKTKEIREELIQLKKEGRSFVLLTTGSYAGEGFDLPILDTLLLVMPISGKNTLQQYLGRLLRNLEDKTDLLVYDYVDYSIPMIYRMYQKRLKTYKQLGYQPYVDEHTELSKSNVLLDDFQSILSRDLIGATTGLLVIPYLDNKLFTQLLSLEKPQNMTLIVVSSSSNGIRDKINYQSKIDQLILSGFTVKYKDVISQYLITLDNTLVWMLPIKSKGDVALRIISKSMVERLEKHFD